MSGLTSLLGEKLLKGGDEIDTASAFLDKKAVAFYFSAHWCPPCRSFTPKLAEAYKSDLGAKGLEVVFISSDRGEDDFKSYFAEMPWLALPYSDRATKDALSKKFKVQGIPTLVVVDPSDGSIITSDGRSAFSRDPTGEKLPWKPPTFAEALGDQFMKGDSSVGKEAIEGKTLGLYFSAHWCPPCRAFTPQLAQWYKAIKGEVGDKFEIIFCSGDRDEESQKSYYKEQIDAGGDWLCLPWASKSNLDPLFQVEGIPAFIIVSPEGKIINKSGRSIVPDAKASGFPWAPPAIGNMEAPEGINDTPSILLMLESVEESMQEKIIGSITPMAQKYQAQEEPELLFFVAKQPGGRVASQVCDMCGISSGTPTVILMDIPDEGSYYVGNIPTELDGSGIRAMIDGWKNKTLEKKSLQK
jgi:nucleoredoxin